MADSNVDTSWEGEDNQISINDKSNEVSKVEYVEEESSEDDTEKRQQHDEKKRKRIEKLKILKEKKKMKLLNATIVNEVKSNTDVDSTDPFNIFMQYLSQDNPLYDRLSPSLFVRMDNCINYSSIPIIRSIISVFPKYKKELNSFGKSVQDHGSPLIIIICSSAIRAADVINSLSSILKCKIAKLFAKHFKLQDQVDILTKGKFPVAVGTPNRVMKLAEYGALQLHHTRLIVIDMKKDAKSFSLLTMPEVKDDLFTFLERYGLTNTNVQIALADE
jgi:hypothetical protein